MSVFTPFKLQFGSIGRNNNHDLPKSNNSSNIGTFQYTNLNSKEDNTLELSQILPPTKRLKSLLSPLLIILILLIFFFFTTFLLNPTSIFLPNFTLKVLAKIKGENYHTFTTSSQFCKPLIDKNELLRVNQGSLQIPNQLNGTELLVRENWAEVITGEDLMRFTREGRVFNGDQIGIIPIIHVSWKSHVIPGKFIKWSESWRATHSNRDGWYQVVWSDADNLQLVSNFYPEWLELYLSLETPIHKADFSRNLYMHRFGGVYADLDVISLLPTSQTLNLTLPSSSQPSISTVYLARMGHSPSFPHSLPNAYFASTHPSHPFWLLPIELAHSKMLLPRNKRGGVEAVTGPVGVWESERSWRRLERGDHLDEKGEGKRWRVEILGEGVIFPFAWSTSWDGPADLSRCLCWGSSHFFNEEKCRTLFPKAGALTFWTKSWASMIEE